MHKVSAGREHASTIAVCLLQDEDAFDPDQIPGASPTPDRPNGNLQRVSWMPVEHALKPEWSWADWVRYWFYRLAPNTLCISRYPAFLLISVILLLDNPSISDNTSRMSPAAMQSL